MKVLIVGCGYVGTALGVELSRKNCQVWGVRRSPVLPAQIQLISKDLLELAPADLPNVDVLIYMPSPDIRDEKNYESVYLDGIGHLLRLYERHPYPLKKIIYISSTTVYEQQDGQWVDESTPCEPTKALNQILLAGESVVRQSEVDFTIIRFSGIYGPNRHPILDMLYRGDARVSLDSRYSNRIYLTDCVRVIEHVLHLRYNEQLYLATDNEPTPINMILSWLSTKTGQPLPEGKIIDSTDPFERRSNKRCNNARLLHTGFRFEFQNYHQGFLDILQKSGVLQQDV